VDGEDGVAAVVFAGKGERKLQRVHLGDELLDVGGDGGGERLVRLGFGETQELKRLAGLRLHSSPHLHLLARVGQAPHHLLRFVGVVPEAGLPGLPLQLFDL
jgi:hypothetical protein